MEFDKMVSKNVPISFDAEESYYSEDDASEWEAYVQHCKEYDESDVDNFESEESDKEVSPVFVHGPIKEAGNVEYDMIVLGENFKQEKKKKSFKYYGINGMIFCSSFAKFNKKCEKSKCKYAHSYDEISTCDGKCKRIEFSNNYYSGNCNKRHKKETFVNFMFRKSIRITGVESADFEFYERPSESFVQNFLETAKKLKISKINFEIVKPPTTLQEFFDSKTPEESEDEQQFLDENDLAEVWGF